MTDFKRVGKVMKFECETFTVGVGEGVEFIKINDGQHEMPVVEAAFSMLERLRVISGAVGNPDANEIIIKVPYGIDAERLKGKILESSNRPDFLNFIGYGEG